MQSNLAVTYRKLGRQEEALQMKRDVYSGCLKIHGEENRTTLVAANNYALSLLDLQRSQEAKSLLRETMPVAQRVLGESHQTTLKMMKVYARTLYMDAGATLDDIREAVTTLEKADRIARRVLGGAHPLVGDIAVDFKWVRELLNLNDPEA